jgi:hypothetical protein
MIATATALSLAVFSFLGESAPAAAQGMALPGKFSVNAAGGASYTIPIVVPPGTAGMIPSLALAYNSQGRNGLVGMGWSVDGLASVDRCPRTLAQDGVRGIINYDANDRFCLDGQRLMVISGTYGADGSEYRTEIESFSRVLAHGTAGTGPAWFEVHTKSGQIMQFGNTTDSRVLAQGKTTARNWALNKVSDTKGNYFTVTYTNDTTNGQAYPIRIDYTANDGAGLAAYNSVRFVYNSSRPDVVPAYHLGSLQQTTVLLTDVQTYAGASLVADYRLAYTQGSATGRSQLTSVTLCDGGSTCLPATTFGWLNGTTTPSVISNPASRNSNLSGYRAYVGDFNGDGMADILWDAEANQASPSSTGTRELWTATGSGNFTVTSNVASENGQLSGYAPVVVDFNRDGKTDLWWYQVNSSGLATGPTSLWLGTGTATFSVSAGPSVSANNNLESLGDLNGDGRTDSVWESGHVVTTAITQPNGTLAVNSLNGCTTQYPGWSGCNIVASGFDYDGDGLLDLLWLQPYPASNPAVALQHGNGLGGFTNVFASNNASVAGYVPYLVDVNGDGNTDILWDNVSTTGQSQGNRILWLSKGDGTFVVQSNVGGQNGTLSGYRAHIGDFNGDGLPDILWVQESSGGTQGTTGNGATNSGSSGLSSGTNVLWLGKGDGTFTVITNAFGLNGTLVGYAPILADVNGDGKTDVLWDSRSGTDTRSTGTRALWLSDGVPPDLINSITTGIGANVAIAYKPLTDGTVYTKDSNAIDPFADLQAPMVVVSRVDASNGIGGTVSSSYAYAGAKSDQNGRGFLGFRQMTVTDLQTNIIQTTNYRLDYPFLTLAASETKTLSGATLNATANAYAATALGGTRYQVFLAQSQATSADLDGSVMPTATSGFQYDTYGNATQIVVSATDGFSKTTNNTYTNDTTNWFLGRLTNASVASLITSPGSAPAQGPTSVVIAYSTSNLNLWNYLVSIGAAVPGKPGAWNVTINSGVTISSGSTSLPALDTGSFPTGSTLQLTNAGTIVGAGGNGGGGGNCFAVPQISGGAGGAGGGALRAQLTTTVVNNGSIWGGGGGGGGAGGDGYASSTGGGGGAGLISGGGGAGYQGANGSAGTLTAGGAAGSVQGAGEKGGNGGGPGLVGAAGANGSVSCGFDGDGNPINPTPGGAAGAAGAAAIGNSFITWTTVGDRRGPLN